MQTGLTVLSAALAISAAAFATAWAQSRIGPAAAAALTEKRELTGPSLIMLAIPETILILGFVIAFMILRR